MTSPARITDDRTLGWDILHHQGIGADLGVVAHRDGADDLGASPDQDPITDGRMTLEAATGTASEGDLVVHEDVVAHDGGLANHHTHAVIDEEPAADAGARMDLDPRRETRPLADEPSKWLQCGGATPQLMRHPVHPDGVDAGIGDRHLQLAPRSRILAHGSFEVLGHARGDLPEAGHHHWSINPSNSTVER